MWTRRCSTTYGGGCATRGGQNANSSTTGHRASRSATSRTCATYWADEYDWRAREAALNRFDQFTTAIDGLDVHFIHVRSPHEDAVPLLITHGWPGSIVEFHKIIEPLTNPTAFGGDAADAFHVVAPSLPGFGFSGKPTDDRLGRAPRSPRCSRR